MTMASLPGSNHRSSMYRVYPTEISCPLSEGRGELSVALYRKNHSAPLLFILPGIGSNPYFGVATYLAYLFYQEGSHIVILPSPISWNFALSVSRSGAT